MEVTETKRSKSKSRPMTDAVGEGPGCLFPEPRDPGADDGPNAVGERQRALTVGRRPPTGGVLDDGPGLGQIAQHLGHEEGVAVGLPVEVVGQGDPGAVEFVSGGRFHVGENTEVVQALQVDARDAGGLSVQPARPSVSGWPADSSPSR